MFIHSTRNVFVPVAVRQLERGEALFKLSLLKQMEYSQIIILVLIIQISCFILVLKYVLT